MSNSSLHHNTLFLTISRLLIHATGMIIVMILTRFMTKNQIGTYNQAFIVIELSGILVLGLPDAVIYFFSTNKNKDFINLILKILFMLMILIVSMLLIFPNIFSNFFENDALNILNVNIAVILVLNMFNLFFYSYLVGKFQIISMIIFQSAFSIIKLLIILLYVFNPNISFEGLFSITMFLYIINFIVQLICIAFNKDISLRSSFKISELKLIFGYSIPLWLSTLSGVLNKLIDKLMVGRYFSTEEFALYSVLGKELPYTLITAVFITVTTPLIMKYLSENNKINALSLWKKTMIYSTHFLVIVVFSNLLMNNELITFLYSGEYLSGSLIFNIYLITLLTHIAYWGMFLKASGKSKYIFYITFFGFLLNVILNLIFIKFFGIIGPALSTLIVSLISIIIYTIINKRIMSISYREMFPLSDLFRIVAINGIIYILLKLLKDYWLDSMSFTPFIKLAIIAILWFLLYSIANIRIVKQILSQFLHKR